MSRYQGYPEYKDSGVEWLGKIPKHWSAKPLKFLCTCNDQVISDTTDSDYELEYVDIGSVSSLQGIEKTERMTFSKSPSRARRLVQDGDVIISTVRTYLEAIAPINNPPPNMVVSTGFAVIRPRASLDKGFAAYCMRASGFIKEVVARSVGVSYPAINASDLISIPVPNCPFNEQSKIAAFLDQEVEKIDNLIEKQQQLIELLKEKCQAVISHAVTKGLNPDVPMKYSGIEWVGEIPGNWVIHKTGYSCEVTKLTGFEYTNHWRTDENGEIIALRGFNIKERYLDLVKTERISNELSRKLSRSKLYVGDLVLPCTGTLGNACIINSNNNYHINQNIAKLTFDESVHSEFAVYWLTSEPFRKMVGFNNTSGMQPVLLIGDIRNMPMPLPSIQEQIDISIYLNDKLSIYDLAIQKNEHAIGLLSERRTALISAAVTGKIDVRNWVAPTNTTEANQEPQEATA